MNFNYEYKVDSPQRRTSFFLQKNTSKNAKTTLTLVNVVYLKINLIYKQLIYIIRLNIKHRIRYYIKTDYRRKAVWISSEFETFTRFALQCLEDVVEPF